MNSTLQVVTPKKQSLPSTMRALVFRGPNQIGVEQVSIPHPGPGEAVIRVTLTTICGTDLHILKGEYPVKPGLVIGHEPVGVIHELGVGDRLRRGRTRSGRRNYPLRAVRLLLGGDWRSAAARSAAGNSATRSTGRRRNTCWCPARRQILQKFPMN